MNFGGLVFKCGVECGGVRMGVEDGCGVWVMCLLVFGRGVFLVC